MLFWPCCPVLMIALTGYINQMEQSLLVKYQYVSCEKCLQPEKMMLLVSKYIAPLGKVTLTSFGRASLSYSAVQPPFDIKLPLLHVFHWQICLQSTYCAQEYQTCTDNDMVLSIFNRTRYHWTNVSSYYFTEKNVFFLSLCNCLQTK